MIGTSSKQKTVLVTGYKSGIGAAIVELLLADDMYTIYGIERTVQGQVSQNGIVGFGCDLSDQAKTATTAETVLAASGGIDILINCAGIGIFKSVDQLTLQDWNTVINTNLTTPYILMSSFLPGMKTRGYGRIINITSDAEHFSYQAASAYNASKAGLKLLSDSVRKEAEGHNIQVTTIAPGRVDTNFNSKQPGDRPNSLKPTDVAKQVLFVLDQSERCEIEQIYSNSILEKSLH